MVTGNDIAKKVVDDLLALPKEEFNRLFEEHKSGEFAELLVGSGMFDIYKPDKAISEKIKQALDQVSSGYTNDCIDTLNDLLKDLGE